MKPDIRLERHGDAFRFIPLTPEAGEWLIQFDPTMTQFVAGGILEASKKQAYVVLGSAKADRITVEGEME